MKPRITLLLLISLIGINNVFSQFTPQKPDLRLCGSAPNYYEGYFNCTSNNYTLDRVFVSLTNVNGVPLSNTTCTPGTSQQMYVMLNYTSNSSSAISQTRIFADLSIDGTVIPLNVYLGNVNPGSNQRQIYGPFTWTCGQELRLCRILVVWQTSGDPADPELSSYTCGSYSKSQCEFGSCMIVAAPLAVEYNYTVCNPGNQSTVTVPFNNETTGGIAPYSYLWNFGDGTTSTQENPVHTFAYPGGPYTVTLTVTDSNLPTHLVGSQTQVVTIPGPCTISGVATPVSCANQNNGSIDVSVSGGTPPFSYSWNGGQTTQDISGLSSGTYTVTVTDAFGCTKSQSFTIGNGDTLNPVITAPNDLSIEGCSPSAIGTQGRLDFSGTPLTITLAQFTAAGGTYTDQSPIATISYQDVVSGSCPTIVTRTFRLTDSCGNVGSDTQIFTINDTTAPVIATLPTPSTINCPGVPQFAQASVTDNCGPGFTLTHNDVTTQGQCAGSYSVTRTWTATDACGNSSTKSQTINVQDTTGPVIAALPATSTINCPAVPQFAQATATDACGSAFTLTFNDVTTPGQCGGGYSVTRTWTATDACGRSSTRSQTINVRDVTAPVVPQAPANVTVSCSGDIPPMISLTANDVCSGPITVTGTDAITAGSCSSSFTVTRTWTFVDACGNTSSVNQTINVRDTSNPVLPTPPENITVSCAGEVPPMISLTASDTCAGQITVAGVDTTTPGNCPGSYIITRRWTFADPCGNTSSLSQTITVQDITAPVIAALPPTTTIICPAVPQFAEATATDNCGSAFTLTYNDVTTPGQCGGGYSVTRTWTATDACGNSSTRSQTINVQDVTPPSVPQAPAGITVSCSGDIPPMISLTANDSCTGPITVVGADAITAGSCSGSFTVTRTWTFVDACGNTSSVNQIINVRDISNPVLPAPPADITVSCTSEIPSMISLTASDTCAGQITVEGVDTTAPGNCANSYIITRTWTFADPCGNSASLSQTITVSDQIPPVLPEVPADITVSCVSEVPAPLSLTAADNCTGNITAESVDAIVQGDCPNSFIVTRTWTFTDSCDNSSTMSQIITVSDETGPELVTNMSDITVSCGNIPAPLLVEFSDHCGGTVTVAYEEHVDPASEVEGSYDIIRTWTATDICGNQTVISQTVHVTVGDTFSADNPELCRNDVAYANFNLMSLLPQGTEPGGQWVAVNLPLGVINQTTNTIDATQLPVGYYTLQYILTTNESTCPRKLEFYVHVADNCGVLAECAIDVFNGFSPDGDGENDVLIIDGLQCYGENNVKIFNRWGIVVFDKAGYNNTTVVFDGRSEGRSTLNKNELLPGGTYFYIVKYKDNEAGNWHDKSGYLYLSR